MKKNRNLGSSGWIRLPQKLLVMNLKILFLVCIVNTVSANSFSQLKKLNVDFSGQEITRVLDFLTTQTGYEFVYRKGVLNTGEKVTLELKEATAEQVLDALLKSRGYDYEIVDQVVVIRKGAAVYAPEIPRHVRVLQGTVNGWRRKALARGYGQDKRNDPGGGDGPERWLSFGTSCR